jgi:hypothetical protein
MGGREIMAEISETKVAQLYNESLDVISRFNKLTPEQLNDFEVARAKIATSVLQQYDNHKKQERETMSFRLAVGAKMLFKEEDRAEFFRMAMPDIKKLLPVPKLEAGKTE